MDTSQNINGIKIIAVFCGFLATMSILKVFSSGNPLEYIFPMTVSVIGLFAFVGLRKSRKYGLWSAIIILLYAIYGSLLWLWFVFSPILSGHVNTPSLLEYYFLLIVLCSIAAIVFLLKEDVRRQLT